MSLNHRYLCVHSRDNIELNTRVGGDTSAVALQVSHQDGMRHVTSIALLQFAFGNSFYNVRNYTHPFYGPMNTFTYTDHVTTRVLTVPEGYYTRDELCAYITANAPAPAGGARTCVHAGSPTYRVTFLDANATSCALPLITNVRGLQRPQWLASLLGFGVSHANAKTAAAGSCTLTAERAADMRPTALVHLSLRGHHMLTAMIGMSQHIGSTLQHSLGPTALAVPFGEVQTSTVVTPIYYQFPQPVNLEQMRFELCDDTGETLNITGRWEAVLDVTMSR